VSAATARQRRRGRPPCCPRELAIRVIHLRHQGLSYAQISAVLNAEGIPTPAGRARWHKTHVDRLLHTQYARDVMAELGLG
jgi:recombinase